MEKRNQSKKAIRILFILFAALAFSGCSYCWGLVFGQPVEPPATVATPAQTSQVQRTPDTGSSVRVDNLAGQQVSLRLSAVMFELDSSHIRPQFQAQLQETARSLQANPGVTIIIEGHCCEIGSGDYNIALGDRRARAVLQYLTDLGVNPARMVMVSYGEEMPVNHGHSEAARSQNRRSEFVIQE